MTIVDLSKQMPRWAELVLAKVERLAQSAAVANRRADVITLERIEALVRGNTLATPAGSASGEDYQQRSFEQGQIIARLTLQLQDAEAEAARLRELLRDTTAVAITMLFDTHRADVKAAFSVDELHEVVEISRPLCEVNAQVEAIYRRSWDAIQGSANGQG